MFAATSFRPSPVRSIGLDLLLVTCTHVHVGVQPCPSSQPVALPSHASPLPTSTTPSPHVEIVATKSTASVFGAFSLPLIVEQSSVMSAVSLTLPLTPSQPPFPKVTFTDVPFFVRFSLALRAAQSVPIAICRFSKTTTSPPRPSSGSPATANRRVSVQSGGFEEAPHADPALNVATTISGSTFHPIDVIVPFSFRCTGKSPLRPALR